MVKCWYCAGYGKEVFYRDTVCILIRCLHCDGTGILEDDKKPDIEVKRLDNLEEV